MRGSWMLCVMVLHLCWSQKQVPGYGRGGLTWHVWGAGVLLELPAWES